LSRRRAQRLAVRRSDHCRAQIIRDDTPEERQRNGEGQRPKVGDEPVVARKKFMELSAVLSYWLNIFNPRANPAPELLLESPATLSTAERIWRTTQRVGQLASRGVRGREIGRSPVRRFKPLAMRGTAHHAKTVGQAALPTAVR